MALFKDFFCHLGVDVGRPVVREVTPTENNVSVRSWARDDICLLARLRERVYKAITFFHRRSHEYRLSFRGKDGRVFNSKQGTSPKAGSINYQIYGTELGERVGFVEGGESRADDGDARRTEGRGKMKEVEWGVERVGFVGYTVFEWCMNFFRFEHPVLYMYLNFFWVNSLHIYLGKTQRCYVGKNLPRIPNPCTMAPSTHLHLPKNNSTPVFHKGGVLPWPDERTVQMYIDLGVAQLR